MRVNDFDTGLADEDLAAAIELDGIVLPNPNGAGGVRWLRTLLDTLEEKAAIPAVS